MMRCEISSRKIIPAIRKELVIQLVKTGKRQNEIAKILEITPAAVTQYIKGKRAKIDLNKAEKNEVSKIVSKCQKNGKIEEREICSLCDEMQKRLIQ